MSGSGTDIWSNSDQFRFAYQKLTGDGSIVAKVNSLANTDPWAKAGVMIRGSLDPAATYAFMTPTADGRRAFQNRTSCRRLPLRPPIAIPAPSRSPSG